MASPIDAISNFILAVPDLTIKAQTEETPLNILLCSCDDSSVIGVSIQKSSINNSVFISVDTSKVDKTPQLVDRRGKIDCLVIKRKKTKPVRLSYSSETNTWSLL